MPPGAGADTPADAGETPAVRGGRSGPAALSPTSFTCRADGERKDAGGRAGEHTGEPGWESGGRLGVRERGELPLRIGHDLNKCSGN